MKKLISLSFIFAFLGLLFAGCQNAENITSPANELEKPKPIVWQLPDAVNADAEGTDVNLVAGQNQIVGKVTISNDADYIYVTYYTFGDSKILETHLAAAFEPKFIPQNSAGNPQIGLFPYGKSMDISSDGSVAGPYKIPIADLPGINKDNMVYIGAHAVVDICEGTVVSSYICPDDLAASGKLVFLTSPAPTTTPTHYVELTFEDNVAYGQNKFLGWCVDNGRGISAGTLNIPVNFLCSYTESIINNCIVNKPDNLGKANWIINNRDGYTWQTVQAALWYLLSDATGWMSDATYSGTPYMDLVNEADPDFVPEECDQKTLVLVYQSDKDVCATDLVQVLAIEVDVQCETECYDETAWAFNYPVDNTSALFPGHVWFRYFGYKVM